MWGLGDALASPDQETREPDAVLVRRAQTSPAAFEALYLRYRDRILGYCYRRLGDRDDAEDAASAVFVAALRGLGRFQDRGDSFGSWLFRIAHNEVAARHRQRARHPEEPLIRVSGAADPARSPEEHAVLADGQQRLAGLLCELPPREREVIELRLADLSTAEIGRVLGISEQNVRTAQARAVARLRRVMSRTGAPETRSAHA
jgi:RNA polymerase sigma-70 factor (ECF subfamily)